MTKPNFPLGGGPAPSGVQGQPVVVSHETFTYVEKSVSFDAAHRLLHHGGKCRHLHGHRYEVTLGVTGPISPQTGILADFALLKSFLEAYVVQRMDHSTLVDETDTLLAEAVQRLAPEEGSRLFLLPGETTAENLAKWILLKALFYQPFVDAGIKPRGVTVCETPTSKAIARSK